MIPIEIIFTQCVDKNLYFKIQHLSPIPIIIFWNSGYFSIGPGSCSQFSSSFWKHIQFSIYNDRIYICWVRQVKKITFLCKKSAKMQFKKNLGFCRVWTGNLEIMNPACYQKSCSDSLYYILLFCYILTKVMNSKDFCTTNSQIKLPQKK